MWLLGNQFAPWVLEAAEGAKYRIIYQGGEGELRCALRSHVLQKGRLQLVMDEIKQLGSKLK